MSSLNETREVRPESVDELAHILFAGASAQETFDAVVNLAQRTVRGCDIASVTLLEVGEPKLIVATSHVADIVDRRQYADGAGPCVEAMRTQRVVNVASYRTERRWPAFVATALSHGLGSSLSLPLIALDEPLGALNLYSHRGEAFDGAEAEGEDFAVQAAITLANATAYHQCADMARNLTVALEHRDVIGQAKGILMARENLTSEQAFDVLRRASQRQNRKLYDIAIDLVERNSTTGRVQ